MLTTGKWCDPVSKMSHHIGIKSNYTSVDSSYEGMGNSPLYEGKGCAVSSHDGRGVQFLHTRGKGFQFNSYEGKGYSI